MVNLAKILKGREGERFYSSVVGEVLLNEATSKMLYFDFIDDRGEIASIEIHPDGGMFPGDCCTIFPSKINRVWL